MAVRDKKKPGPPPKTLTDNDRKLIALLEARIGELEAELAKARQELGRPLECREQRRSPRSRGHAAGGGRIAQAPASAAVSWR